MNTSIVSTGSAIPVGFCSFAAENKDNSMMQHQEAANGDNVRFGLEISFAESQKDVADQNQSQVLINMQDSPVAGEGKPMQEIQNRESL